MIEGILPHAAFPRELYKRISLLAEADNVFEHDGRPLPVPMDGVRQAFFHHTRDLDFQHSGVVVNLRDGLRMYCGLKQEWLQVLQSQNLTALSLLNWEPSSAVTTLAVFEEPEGTSKRPQRRKKPKSERAYLHTTSSGRVFGLLGNTPKSPVPPELGQPDLV